MADDKKKISLSFAALNPYIEQSIISPKEEKYPGREFIQWGDRNAYPDYLEDLCENVASLQSIIDGSADYVCGEQVNVSRTLQGQYMNRKKQTADDLVRDLAISFFTYGGFAVQVIRSQSGDIAELYAMDMKNLRCDKDNEVFYYSETWNRRFSMVKTLVYPKFIPDARSVPSSVLFVKNTAYHTYPRPKYAACLKACEIERSIDEYHLNSINNGFMGSVLVNFNNGAPTDEEQEEVEKGINEKFAGKNNAGRIIIAYNDTKENATTIESIDVPDYGDRYDSLAKRSRQQIFTAFRANPNLFGIPTENLGFSQEEYDAAFRLYNRTQIMPVQKLICRSIGKIFGDQNYMTIEPFTLAQNGRSSTDI
jgi:phage portal protein BeeE